MRRQAKAGKARTLFILLSLFSLIATGLNARAKSEAEEPADPAEATDSAEPPRSAEPTYPGLITHIISVAETDPDLAGVDRRSHWAYFQPGTKARGQLLIYLCGSHGTGEGQHAFNSLAAQTGYHVLSLTYRSGIALAAFRKSADPDAFLKGRENIIYGAAAIGPLTVDPANSILNRLVKALAYLDKTYPKEGWAAYLDKGQPAWSRLVLAGLSQGGGHACFLGMQHHVARVIMFGAPKDNSLRFKRPAKWLSMPSKTPITSFFCLNHSLDEGHGCSYAEQIENYKAMGLFPRFPIVDVDESAPPYGHTRLLTSHKPADIPKHNHGVVVGDFSLYSAAWKYLLSEPCP